MHFGISWCLPSPPKALPYYLQPRKNATPDRYVPQKPPTTTHIQLVSQGAPVHSWGEAKLHLHTPQQCLLALQPQVEQLRLVASWVTCLGKMTMCVCVGGGMCVLVTQLCLTLCNTMYCSPPASSIHGIIHSRKLEWVAMLSSRRSSWPRNWTRISCISGGFFTVSATREA